MALLFRLTAYFSALIFVVSSKKIPCGSGKCLCYKHSDQLKMVCADKKILSIKEIWKDIPVNTTILDLGRNNISKLENKTFGNCENLKNLQFLNLTHNKIKAIHTLAFRGLTLLKKLDISYNYLNNIVAVFPANIQELCLNHNFITKLYNHTFSNKQNAVRRLEKLHLQSNTLKEIELYAFEGLHNFQLRKHVRAIYCNISRL